MDSPSNKNRVRLNSTASESNSDESKQVQVDLLDVLEDSDFIKSFEHEISKLPTSDFVSGDLGFLFEASDDELGLPPTELTQTESVVLSDSFEDWGFGDQMCGFESLEYGFGYALGDYDDEYVKLDGLFDHTELGFGSPEISFLPETMPAK